MKEKRELICIPPFREAQPDSTNIPREAPVRNPDGSPPRSVYLELDLHNNAIHEAAHAVTAWWFGITSQIRIQEEEGDPTEKSIATGTCRFFGQLPARDFAIVGLAGSVAVCKLDAEGEWQIPDEILENIEEAGISQTDLEGIRAHLPGGLEDAGIFDLIEETQRLVMECWEHIQRVANHVVNLYAERNGSCVIVTDRSWIEVVPPEGARDLLGFDT